MISLNEVKKFLLKTQVVQFLSQCGIAAAAASPTIVCCLFPPASPRPSRDACWPPRQSFRPFGHPAHQHVGCTARQSPHLAGCADPPADPTALLAFLSTVPPAPTIPPCRSAVSSRLAGRLSLPARWLVCHEQRASVSVRPLWLSTVPPWLSAALSHQPIHPTILPIGRPKRLQTSPRRGRWRTWQPQEHGAFAPGRRRCPVFLTP